MVCVVLSDSGGLMLGTSEDLFCSVIKLWYISSQADSSGHGREQFLCTKSNSEGDCQEKGIPDISRAARYSLLTADSGLTGKKQISDRYGKNIINYKLLLDYSIIHEFSGVCR